MVLSTTSVGNKLPIYVFQFALVFLGATIAFELLSVFFARFVGSGQVRNLHTWVLKKVQSLLMMARGLRGEKQIIVLSEGANCTTVKRTIV